MEAQLKEFKKLALKAQKIFINNMAKLGNYTNISKDTKYYFGSDYDTFTFNCCDMSYSNYSDKFDIPARYNTKRITEIVELAKSDIEEYVVELAKSDIEEYVRDFQEKYQSEFEEKKAQRIEMLKNELAQLSK